MKQQKSAEFDTYAADYAALIRDPIRDKFASSSRFFFERKIEVIRQFYDRQRIDTRRLTWLDVGCGQGDMLRLGQSHFGLALGCDVSEGMLKSCQDLQVRQQRTPEDIPFGDNQIDFVTAVCVYHHVPVERRPVLTAAILRVLRPRGVFCVIEHNPLNPATQLIVSRTPVDADAHLLRAKSTIGLMTAAGATMLDTRYFLLLPQRLYKYFGVLENRLTKVPIGGQYAAFASKTRT